VIADINKNAADEVATKIINEDANKKDYVMAIELDVTDEQAIQNAVKTVVANGIQLMYLSTSMLPIRIISKSLTSVFLVLLCLYLVQLKMYQQKHGLKY